MHTRLLHEEWRLNDRLRELMRGYIHSKHIICCSNAPEDHRLMFHYLDEEDIWLSHLIERNALHRFDSVRWKDLPGFIQDFYAFPASSQEGIASFRLTEEAFDKLSVSRRIDPVRMSPYFTSEERWSFRRFLADFEARQGMLCTIAHFQLSGLGEELAVRDMAFFLPSIAGVWVARYAEGDEYPICMQLYSNAQWAGLLKEVGRSALS